MKKGKKINKGSSRSTLTFQWQSRNHSKDTQIHTHICKNFKFSMPRMPIKRAQKFKNEAAEGTLLSNFGVF
jgi:hypothetical protein